MPAILFGSISTIADTSELQRHAFNQAFKAHGLDWCWDREDYIAMLEHSGGSQRIADFGRAVDQQVDAPAVHSTKSEIFQASLAASTVAPRPGVVETIRNAKKAGLKVALVTTTSPRNVSALMEALRPQLNATDFDVIVDETTVEEPKPDKAAYAFAIERLGESQSECVAVDDNVGGVQAAVAAGVSCVAFPNENTAGHDFAVAEYRVERLDFDELKDLLDSQSSAAPTAERATP